MQSPHVLQVGSYFHGKHYSLSYVNSFLGIQVSNSDISGKLYTTVNLWKLLKVYAPAVSPSKSTRRKDNTDAHASKMYGFPGDK